MGSRFQIHLKCELHVFQLNQLIQLKLTCIVPSSCHSYVSDNQQYAHHWKIKYFAFWKTKIHTRIKILKIIINHFFLPKRPQKRRLKHFNYVYIRIFYEICAYSSLLLLKTNLQQRVKQFPWNYIYYNCHHTL